MCKFTTQFIFQRNSVQSGRALRANGYAQAKDDPFALHMAENPPLNTLYLDAMGRFDVVFNGSESRLEMIIVEKSYIDAGGERDSEGCYSDAGRSVAARRQPSRRRNVDFDRYRREYFNTVTALGEF